MNSLKNAKKRRPLIRGRRPQHLPDERFEVSSGGKAGIFPHSFTCSRCLSALLLCLFLLCSPLQFSRLTFSMTDIEHKNEQTDFFRLLVSLSLCTVSLLLLTSLFRRRYRTPGFFYGFLDSPEAVFSDDFRRFLTMIHRIKKMRNPAAAYPTASSNKSRPSNSRPGINSLCV